MKLYTTFIDGEFAGYKTLSEIAEIKRQARENAYRLQQKVNADHMIYGYTSYKTNNEIDAFHFYSGLAKTEEEFEDISKIKNSVIYAFHK